MSEAWLHLTQDNHSASRHLMTLQSLRERKAKRAGKTAAVVTNRTVFITPHVERLLQACLHSAEL